MGLLSSAVELENMSSAVEELKQALEDTTARVRALFTPSWDSVGLWGRLKNMVALSCKSCNFQGFKVWRDLWNTAANPIQ